jgi:two-component system response regulator RegA
LIIDDEEVFASTLARSLARRGMQADWVCSPDVALQLAEQRPYTDITLDLNLGEYSGLLYVQPLRQARPLARLLVLTGYASIATTVQAMKLGADNYLAKPADTTTILRALDENAPFLDAEGEGGFQSMSVSRLEWEHIQRVLTEHQGNVSASARALNMHRRTLQRKLAKKPMAR